MNSPPIPLLTADLPGCGGLFKATPEDFEVEEVPAYPPLGEGEHLFLWVEKRGRGTPEVAKTLARHFQVPERAVSYAGLKDRQAVTRQFFCLPAKAEPLAASFSDPEVQLL
ncbi:MAG: tRNA pseudouridine(13) synthase TruD, partial [Myxococcaceae bacterium]